MSTSPIYFFPMTPYISLPRLKTLDFSFPSAEAVDTLLSSIHSNNCASLQVDLRTRSPTDLLSSLFTAVRRHILSSLNSCGPSNYNFQIILDAHVDILYNGPESELKVNVSYSARREADMLAWLGCLLAPEPTGLDLASLRIDLSLVDVGSEDGAFSLDILRQYPSVVTLYLEAPRRNRNGRHDIFDQVLEALAVAPDLDGSSQCICPRLAKLSCSTFGWDVDPRLILRLVKSRMRASEGASGSGLLKELEIDGPLEPGPGREVWREVKELAGEGVTFRATGTQSMMTLYP